MSTHNIGFYEEISKIITYHQISSNTHLISSAVYTMSIHALLSDMLKCDSMMTQVKKICC